MALTVVKYRKGTNSGMRPQTPTILIKNKLQNLPNQNDQEKFQTNLALSKRSIIKLGGNSGLVINKIPAIIKPASIMKRPITGTADPNFKTAKYSVQAINSTGAPLTSFQWQQPIGGNLNNTIPTIKKEPQLGAVISSLPPNTIIKPANQVPITPNNHSVNQQHSLLNVNASTNALQMRRPTIYIKREVPKRTIRTITLELIEKNPFIHLGVHSTRLPMLKNIICPTANVNLVDCYITLKKLRQNEDFSLLAEYFEMGEDEVQQTFARTVVKLARYMRFLIRWPDSKSYYDRHKNLPFAFRQNLSHVQSLVECVETDMLTLSSHTDCNNYKFILSINTNGIITFVSDVYVGHHDDLSIFSASNFKNVIPKYLSLMAVPGKAIRRRRKPKSIKAKQVACAAGTDSTTDSADESADDMAPTDVKQQSHTLSKYAVSRVAGELASDQSLTVVNNELTSKRVKNFTIPTMHVREPVCRLQIRHTINLLREFKILQHLAIQETLLYQYLNEILVVSAALINLQR